MESKTEELINNLIVSYDNRIKSLEKRNSYFHLYDDITIVLAEKSDSEKEEVYEKVLNYYLTELEKNGSRDKYSDIESLTNEMLNDIIYFKPNDENDKSYRNDFADFVDEAEYIAFELFFKVISNKRKLSLPIAIDNIKDYSLKSDLPQDIYNKTFEWIILTLAIVKFNIINC